MPVSVSVPDRRRPLPLWPIYHARLRLNNSKIGSERGEMMNVKRFLLACVAVYVVYQILGFVIHMVYLGETYAALDR